MANHVVSGVRAALSTNDRTYLVQRHSLTQWQSRFLKASSRALASEPNAFEFFD